MKQGGRESSYQFEMEMAHTAIYKLIDEEINAIFKIKRDVEEVAIENMKGEVAIEDNGGVVTLSRHALNKSKCANFFVLGGIIVNTPAGMPDFFAPKRFEVHTKVGGRGDCSHVRDLLGVFDAPRVERLGGLFFNVLCNEDTTDTPRVEGLGGLFFNVLCNEDTTTEGGNSDQSNLKNGKWRGLTQENLPEGDSSWRKHSGQPDQASPRRLRPLPLSWYKTASSGGPTSRRSDPQKLQRSSTEDHYLLPTEGAAPNPPLLDREDRALPPKEGAAPRPLKRSNGPRRVQSPPRDGLQALHREERYLPLKRGGPCHLPFQGAAPGTPLLRQRLPRRGRERKVAGLPRASSLSPTPRYTRQAVRRPHRQPPPRSPRVGRRTRRSSSSPLR